MAGSRLKKNNNNNNSLLSWICFRTPTICLLSIKHSTTCGHDRRLLKVWTADVVSLNSQQTRKHDVKLTEKLHCNPSLSCRSVRSRCSSECTAFPVALCRRCGSKTLQEVVTFGEVTVYGTCGRHRISSLQPCRTTKLLILKGSYILKGFLFCLFHVLINIIKKVCCALCCVWANRSLVTYLICFSTISTLAISACST